MASLFLFELHVTTRPTLPAILGRFINPLLTLMSRPPYLPFQALTLARKLVLTFFIALSQIGPLLTTSQSLPGQTGSKDVHPQQLDRLDVNIHTADQEISRLLALELMPLAADQPAMQELRGSMRRWLVDNTVRSNAEVRTAVGRVLERRRAGVPAGAQGAR